MEPTIVATRCGPVEVAEVGAGPPVLLVHGMPGDWSQAAPLARALADEHRVLLVSRPGYGRTPARTGGSWRQSAAAYAALLDALELERAAIVGISGGGPSSHAFANHERHRCSALVLCCAVHPDAQVVPAALRVLYALPVLRTALTRLVNAREVRALRDPEAALEQVLAAATDHERLLVADDPIAVEHLLEFLHHHARVSRDMRPFRQDLRRIVAHQRRGIPLSWEPGPDIPTLILQGDADTVVTPDQAARYRDGIPGARMEVFGGAGHAFLFTFRKQSTALLHEFLATAAHR